MDSFAGRLRWAERTFPGFRIVDKRKSWLMRTIFWGAGMWIWCPWFLDRFATTIGKTVFVPKDPADFGSSGISDLALLNHELKHVEDSHRFGAVLWSVLYLFPQCLAPLAILGVVWWPLWLFAAAVLPWPAPFRAWAEKRAYFETIRTAKSGLPADHFANWSADYLERMRAVFTGWPYYKMAWHWEGLRVEFERELGSD